MEDWLKCQIRPLIKYRQNQKKNKGSVCLYQLYFMFSFLNN